METDIRIFENAEFGTVRTIMINDEPWFVGKDIAKILGYTETAKAIRMHVDEDDKGVSVLDTPGGRQRFTVINESGLYSLILSSKLNKAKQFKRWVTSDILPTIRRTGGYVSNDELFTNTYLPFADDNTKALFRLQLMTIRQLNARIEHDQPLVEFAEHVASTNDVIDMNTMAKLAAQKNIRIGRTRMMRWMKKKKILLPNNLPYQKYIDKGYFVVKETTYKRGSKTFTYQQAFVTGKGQVFLINRLKAEYLEGV